MACDGCDSFTGRDLTALAASAFFLSMARVESCSDRQRPLVVYSSVRASCFLARVHSGECGARWRFLVATPSASTLLESRTDTLGWISNRRLCDHVYVPARGRGGRSWWPDVRVRRAYYAVPGSVVVDHASCLTGTGFTVFASDRLTNVAVMIARQFQPRLRSRSAHSVSRSQLNWGVRRTGPSVIVEAM